jgi:hypothetical protein
MLGECSCRSRRWDEHKSDSNQPHGDTRENLAETVVDRV